MLRPSNRAGLLTIAVAALAAFPVPRAISGTAQGHVATEYDVKAAFLYNFTKFVEWPPEAFRDDSAPFVMAVLAPDSFGSALDSIVAGKGVNGRPLVIRHLRDSSGLKGCHMLFVSSRKAGAFSRLLPSLSHRPILTVGETDRFIEGGGIVQFVERQRKVRFRINVAAAQRAALKIGSRLLSLAEALVQE